MNNLMIDGLKFSMVVTAGSVVDVEYDLPKMISCLEASPMFAFAINVWS